MVFSMVLRMFFFVFFWLHFLADANAFDHVVTLRAGIFKARFFKRKKINQKLFETNAIL